jgi:nicotinate-nucleotide adenylyltransferase
VFGGTFDPIHIGHLIIAIDVQAVLELDTVLFVPAGHPPHKPDSLISSNEDRLFMLDAALSGQPSFKISTVDLDRPGPSFTADTLAQLATQHPSDDLFFIMGADSLRDFPTWRDPERILDLAQLAVAARPAVPIDINRVNAEIPGAAQRIHLVDTPSIGISASSIRKRVSERRPITFQVPAEVERYILEQRLYRPAIAL